MKVGVLSGAHLHAFATMCIYKWVVKKGPLLCLTHTHTHTCEHTYTHRETHTHTHVKTRTHTERHTHTHTHANMYTHTHRPFYSLPLSLLFPSISLSISL